MAEEPKTPKDDAPVLGSEMAPSAPSVPAERKSPEERKAMLANLVANVSAQGFRVESQSDFQAVIVKGKPINHALHIIVSIFTAGLWLIGYGIIAATGGEKREIAKVDEYGNVARQKV